MDGRDVVSEVNDFLGGVYIFRDERDRVGRHLERPALKTPCRR